MNELTETQLEGLLEELKGLGLYDSIGSITAVITAVIFVMISFFMLYMFISKKNSERKMNEEFSSYYDDYMNSAVDMSFDDYVFCRKHGVDVDGVKSKLKKSEDTPKEEPEEIQ